MIRKKKMIIIKLKKLYLKMYNINVNKLTIYK